MCDVVCGFLASTEADKMTIMLDNMEYQVFHKLTSQFHPKGRRTKYKCNE